MKNKIFFTIQFLLTILLLINPSGCKKDPETGPDEVDTREILQAYPGVHGEIVEFVINEDTITCEKINGEYIFQGDIVLTEEQLYHSDSLKGAGRPLMSFNFRWPKGIVYYEIDNTISDHSKILEAMNEIEKSTYIRFYPHNTELYFVQIVPGVGYDSNIGVLFSGGQKIRLKSVLDRGKILHEICHTLGMIHEQSRWDRDDYVIIHEDNIVVGNMETNFKKTHCFFTTGSFDFNSIMMYPSKISDLKIVIDPQKPIITKKDGSVEGIEYESQDDHLSAGDIELLNKMYSDDFVVSSPNVITYNPTKISATDAILGGKVTNDGNAYIFEKGVFWGTLQNPVTTGNKFKIGEGIGSFSKILSGLNSNTTYYFKAYAINSVGIAYGDQVTFTTASVSGQTEIVTDIEGNIYNTIIIGTQTWMKENLKVTKYKDGTSIPNITKDNDWRGLNTGAYCWYENNISYKGIYGALYNWFAVNTGNLCPIGWHVPSDAEWTTLTTYLGGVSVAGGKLKEDGDSHWTRGNVGATNETGFTALPGGSRVGDLVFCGIGSSGIWWGSSDYTYSNAYVRGMMDYSRSVSRASHNKSSGFSVRCLKDN
jgi:uncharacterized protein (TIGR02145 family)